MMLQFKISATIRRVAQQPHVVEGSHIHHQENQALIAEGSREQVGGHSNTRTWQEGERARGGRDSSYGRGSGEGRKEEVVVERRKAAAETRGNMDAVPTCLFLFYQCTLHQCSEILQGIDSLREMVKMFSSKLHITFAGICKQGLLVYLKLACFKELCTQNLPQNLSLQILEREHKGVGCISLLHCVN